MPQFVSIIPSFSGFASKLSAGTSAASATAGKTAGSKFSSGFGASIKSFAGPALVLGGLAAVTKGLGDMVTEAREAQKVGAQTEAVLKSTGGAANVSAGQVAALAEQISRKVGIDDEAIQSGENLLLTFKNIRNETGAGNDVFNQATEIITDMSVAMGQDMKSSAIQVGKALNDPIKGMTALSRVGVTFTEQQTEQVTALVESGDALGAQKIILHELNTEFGGSAEAAATAGEKFSVAFANMQEAAGEKLLPALDKLATFGTEKVIPAVEAIGGAAADAVGFFADLPGPVKKTAVAIGAVVLAQKAFRTTAVTGALTNMASGMKTLGIRTQFAGEAFTTARKTQGRFAAGFAGVKAGATGLGKAFAGMGRTAAGGIGVLALSMNDLDESTDPATEGLGKLVNVAGAAAIGFSVGGPWGAAIGGGIGLLMALGDENQDTAGDVDSLSNTLDQQTGAVTGNSYAWAAHELNDRGLIDNVTDMGLSAEQVTKAMLGNEDALAKVNAQLDALPTEEIHLAGGGTTQAETADVTAMRDALADTNGTLGEARDKWQFVHDAQQAAGDASEGFKRKNDDTTESVQDQVDAINKDINAHNRLADTLLENSSAQNTYAQAVLDARKEAEDGRRTIDRSTQAGIDNRVALDDLAGAWNDMGNKVQGQEGAFRKAHDNFVQTARDMGFGKEKANDLADALLDIPNKTVPQVGMDISEAVDKGRFLIREVFNNGLRKAFNLIAGYTNQPDLPAAPTFTVPGVQQFATGGYTGAGSKFRPAGIVHADEYVIRSESQRRIERENPGILDHINRLGTAKGYTRPRGATGIGGDPDDERRLRRDLGFREGGKARPVSPKVEAAFQHGLDFARGAQGGYTWGGVGPVGYDCSGFMGAIANVIAGRLPPYFRIGTSASAPGWRGFQPGPGLFSVGYANPFPGSSVGHVAGTLMGVNVESSGDAGPHTGPGARGANDPGFAGIMHMGPDVSLGALGAGGSFGMPAKLRKKIMGLIQGVRTDAQSGLSDSPYARTLGVEALRGADGLTELLDAASATGGGVGAFSGNHAGLIHASVAKAKAYAQSRLRAHGWSGGQFNPLDTLWGTRESGWSWHATNPTGASPYTASAYGIPQANPPEKMAAAGKDWVDNAGTQIDWGLNYIKSAYGSPSSALAHSTSVGWYDQGGLWKNNTTGINTSGGSEAVLTPDQTRAFQDGMQALADINRKGKVPDRPDRDGRGSGGGLGREVAELTKLVRRLLESPHPQRMSGSLELRNGEAYVEGIVAGYSANDRAHGVKMARMARR